MPIRLLMPHWPMAPADQTAGPPASALGDEPSQVDHGASRGRALHQLRLAGDKACESASCLCRRCACAAA